MQTRGDEHKAHGISPCGVQFQIPNFISATTCAGALQPCTGTANRATHTCNSGRLLLQLCWASQRPRAKPPHLVFRAHHQSSSVQWAVSGTPPRGELSHRVPNPQAAGGLGRCPAWHGCVTSTTRAAQVQTPQRVHTRGVPAPLGVQAAVGGLEIIGITAAAFSTLAVRAQLSYFVGIHLARIELATFSVLG